MNLQKKLVLNLHSYFEHPVLVLADHVIHGAHGVGRQTYSNYSNIENSLKLGVFVNLDRCPGMVFVLLLQHVELRQAVSSPFSEFHIGQISSEGIQA